LENRYDGLHIWSADHAGGRAAYFTFVAPFQASRYACGALYRRPCRRALVRSHSSLITSSWIDFGVQSAYELRKFGALTFVPAPWHFDDAELGADYGDCVIGRLFGVRRGIAR